MSLPPEDEPDDQVDEAQLFREAVRGVKPLGTRLPSPRGPKPRARARFARADRLAVLRESMEAPAADPEIGSGEELSFRRPVIQTSVMRRLRRGEYRVQREIDLHGFTVVEAKQALREFLADALEHQLTCVRIVHGKGLRSGHRGPVLKSAVNAVLKRTGTVLAYTSAREVDGGTGAVYVLLLAP